MKKKEKKEKAWRNNQTPKKKENGRKERSFLFPRKFLINPKLKRRKRDGVFRSPKLACNGGKGEINLGYTDRWWKKIELDRVVDSK